MGVPQRSPGSSSEIPEHIMKYYLQLPFRSVEIEQLTNEITGKNSEPKDKIKAIVSYLQKNYQYTTTDLPWSDADPVSEFLFRKKAGHCEYFATSMVLMLRYINIPARLVNGFLEGEYNDLGDFFLVRHSDAHSWGEVYLDGNWVSVDPSPIPPALVGSFRSLLTFHKILESIQFFWDRYVLIFSAQDQLDAVSLVRDEYQKLGAKVREKYTASSELLLSLEQIWKKSRLLFGMVSGLVVIAFFALRHLWQRRRRLQVATSPILFYQEMLSILEGKGYSRTPSSTPAEFVERIGIHLTSEAKQDVMHLTDLFYKARFGNYPLSSIEQNDVEASLCRLQQL
jgi:hypothetical protein